MSDEGHEREYLLLDRVGDVCGVVRIERTETGRIVFEWQPHDGSPPLRVPIAETMRASQFLEAWYEYQPPEGLRLVG